MAEPAVPWSDALRAMESRLDALERGEPVTPFEPPTVDGPIPAGLVDRAEVIAARGAAVQARLEADAARIKGELRRMPRIAASGGGAARFEVDA